MLARILQVVGILVCLFGGLAPQFGIEIPDRINSLMHGVVAILLLTLFVLNRAQKNKIDS